jgi:uncharacterized protein (DUF1501 family)
MTSDGFEIGRRMFFQRAGAALSTIAQARNPTPFGRAKHCIFILLEGAPSHTDTFDLKEGPWTPAYFNPASYGDVRFPQGLLPDIASHLDSIAILRSVRARSTNHGLARTWLQTGRDPILRRSKNAPHIGSVAAMIAGSRNQLPAFVSLDTQSDQPGLQSDFDAARRMAYGNTRFGNACLTARDVIKADRGSRFIQIDFGSWDHHENIYAPNANLQAMSRQFDRGVGQLIAELKQDGLLDRTLIVATGEFGRTAGPLNRTAGRDHHLRHSVMVAGARVTPRKAIGVTDALGAAIVDPGWSQNREIRPEDLQATILYAMGIDWTKTLNSDRFECHPVTELWS